MPKEPIKPETSDGLKLRCQTCGKYATTRLVSIRQNRGMLYTRFRKIIEGELCKSCIRKYAVRFTAINLVAGWWGMISFFVTPVYIVNNAYQYCRTFGMKD